MSKKCFTTLFIQTRTNLKAFFNLNLGSRDGQGHQQNNQHGHVDLEYRRQYKNVVVSWVVFTLRSSMN